MIPPVCGICNHLVSDNCMATQQVNVRLDDELIEQLKTVADKYSYRSHNEVARDLIETYLPMWKELQAAKEEFLQQQQGRLMQPPKRRVG
jgi:predicted transcriptional regulator